MTAWILRYLHNLKRKADRLTDKGSPPPLTPDELTLAHLQLVRMVQRDALPKIIEGLQNNPKSVGKHELSRLTPILDETGCLRVGGRLKHSLLSPDAKHPLILPREASLTRLLIEDCHIRTLPPGHN